MVYYGIHLIITGECPASLFTQQAKNDLFLSPNGRLSDMDKMAHLGTKELAEKFKDAYLPRLYKRYGNDIDVRVDEWRTGDSESNRKRIMEDSILATKRLETGILAPNQKP